MAQRKRAGPITQRSMDRNHPLLALLAKRVFSILAFFNSKINLLSCQFPWQVLQNAVLVFTGMWPWMPPLPTTTKILKSWFTIHFTNDGNVGWVGKVALIQGHHKFLTAFKEQVVAWPSGLRRCVQVAVSPGGVGSNPTAAISGFRCWIPIPKLQPNLNPLLCCH